MIATLPEPDTVTKAWMRDASDELAVRNGCWFDEERGQFVVDWMRDYLRLYEGDQAGEPFECCNDWQYEFVMRLFGWVRQSEDWGREVRRFRKGIVFIPKKNKKSPTLAAVTVYAAFGDGEPGQKCFPTAKDGAQIRENVVRHIHEMILQSPALNAECKINKNTGQVFHEPSRSLIMPLSSDNIRSQKSKEGLNGSVFVDEVHVVDKSHMRRISRAGISRAEPIQLEVSTVGNEMESYGYERWEYAQGIISGVNQDDQTLAMVYAAPQDLKDEDLDADPVKWGRLSNPAWGHTVKQSEFLADYAESKATAAGLADFKMYRLNIWQQSSNPWLRITDWHACPAVHGELPTDSLTYGGIDCAKTTDFFAWMRFQPDDETPRCSGHYWIPRRRALELERSHNIPIMDWVRDGWVTLGEDNALDYGFVNSYLKEESERYPRLEYVGFDRWHASEIVNYCEKQLGWQMIQLAQGPQTMSLPAKELERLVVDSILDYRFDPVLTWMIANTSIKADENGNIRTTKTVGGVHKHIDGVVALIMAIAVNLANPDPVSIYEQPGALVW